MSAGTKHTPPAGMHRLTDDPVVGDPAFDVVQHVLNRDERHATHPRGLPGRIGVVEVDAERVRLSLFARCVQASVGDPTMRDPSRRLAP